MVQLGEWRHVAHVVERRVQLAQLHQRADAREILEALLAIQSTWSLWNALPNARAAGTTLLLRRSLASAGMARPMPLRSHA